MACSFCNNNFDGVKLVDSINPNSNKKYLTCVKNFLRIWENYSYLGCYNIEYCPVCGRNFKTEEERQTRCKDCKFSRPLDRTKFPEKYYRDDCVICECEDVVGDEPMVYPAAHYCSFARSK